MKTALLNYRIRHSPKSKNLRLKVTREEGLCVVVPPGFDEKKIPAILERKKVWISDATKQVNTTRRFLEPRPSTHLPETLKLTALGETWPVVYREDAARTVLRIRAEQGKLIVTGAVMDRAVVIRKLKDWLRLRVREELFPVAESIATKHSLSVNGLLVRSQRTRWASCSSKRNLSLNTKLLFLAPDLVRYVLIHELCHTVHMNHSHDFWRLLASYEPGFKQLDGSLRNAWRCVPQWAF
jgi:predicted metal-dependent hydrolase